MVLRAIKEVIGFGDPVVSLRVGSSQPVEISASVRESIPFVRPDWNIAEAQKHGIHPVNFHQLSEQFSKDEISNSVLFDTPPHGLHTGNHWRVTQVDSEFELVTIQLCSIFGNYDYRVPPFTVSQYDILFTGMSTQKYERNDKPISLNDVNVSIRAAGFYDRQSRGFPNDIKWKGETIYWADGSGKLAPRGGRVA